MCVNNLSKVALDSAAAGIEPATFQSQVQRPNHYATEPPRCSSNFKQVSTI